MLPDSYPTDRRKTATKEIQFLHSRTFRRTRKQGEQGKGCQRSARTGTRGNFIDIPLISSHSKLLRAFDGQCRSPTIPKPKGTKRYVKVRILLGFYWGTFSANLLLRGAQMWYHESTNRRKRFISRKNVFLIVGKVPAEVVA